MDIFLEILKYILPALVVLGATYVVLSKQLANEADRRNFELRKLNVNQITPVRLRAYERLTLLLYCCTDSLYRSLSTEILFSVPANSSIKAVTCSFDFNSG